ncbi:MAG: stage 0 sporulation family protein [Streptococcaceae bacterium]|jgi:cell fate regulator YaaT (PSP1 superfamily)|nr:stage 0 sporulation family protein [Streptococcaceae bacterium]
MKVIGVRFKTSANLHYYDTQDQEFQLGEYVIGETPGGVQLGEVIWVKENYESPNMPTSTIERRANSDDLLIEKENMELAKEAKKIVQEKIKEHNLDMQLVNVEYAFDRSKVVFNFTSDGYVDFRELVKDMAGYFKTRIELRQIGVRDEAKILGGIGPCGRPLCCTSFLGDFMPVSIKMAKDQGLSLNPIKISGLCGRLMCCLKYEQDEYELAKKEMPDWGTFVETPDGPGRVEGINLLSRIVKVKLKGRETYLEYAASEVSVVPKK